MRIFAVWTITGMLLFLYSIALSQEAPLVVIKDTEQRYSFGTEKDIARLEDLIAEKGSIIVWITLDPRIVKFSPGLIDEVGDDEKREQDTRIANELRRILSPIIAAGRASLIRSKSATQLGHAGSIRIHDNTALHQILSEPSVLIVSSGSHLAR